jgi:antitoxin (DNA-binding transcriptional repressor) of toxin-antitoxin stability system
MKLGETIRIERHGKPVGFFVPVPTPKHNRREIDESLDRVGEVVERVLAQTGLDEEDLVRALVPEDQQG